MNMFARFDKNPAMTLQDIKETKRYGRTDGRTHGQRENSIPTKNKVCGGYKNGHTILSRITLVPCVQHYNLLRRFSQLTDIQNFNF